MLKNILAWIAPPQLSIEQEIISALQSDPIDSAKLRLLSENGFEEESWRQKIWPKLLGISKNQERMFKIESMKRKVVNGDSYKKLSIETLNKENKEKIQTSHLQSDKDNEIENPKFQSSNYLQSVAMFDYGINDENFKNVQIADDKTLQLNSKPSQKRKLQNATVFKRTVETEKLIQEQVEQINKDVERSLWKYTVNDTDAERGFKRKQLNRIIIHCLHERSDVLYYFQGLHDICTVFLMVCGEQTAKIIMDRLVDSYFFDATHSQKMDTILSVLKLIHTLIQYQDPEVAMKMEEAMIYEGHYALSWVLTWFSHVIEELNLISRLFDLFLSKHPIFVIYVCANYVLHIHRENILEGEVDFAYYYSLLNRFQVPTEEQLVEIIQSSLIMFKNLGPNTLLRKYVSSSHGAHILEELNDIAAIRKVMSGKSTPSQIESALSQVDIKIIAKKLHLENYYNTYPYTFTKLYIKPDVKEIHEMMSRKYTSNQSTRNLSLTTRRHSVSTRLKNFVKRKDVLTTLASVAIIVVAIYLLPSQRI